MQTGIICLDKPKDMTSFGAVARLRRITGIKKAGHAGTLDPMATGVLPVMLSGATRFIDFLPSQEKGYLATVRLGVTTDTLDITGTIIRETAPLVSETALRQALDPFRGEILQVPPMYSALHIDGERLYDLARKGIEVERQARPITIHKLVLQHFDKETMEFTIDVLASKGTYIRSLAADIGEALGCGATLVSLRRTLACGFSLREAVTLEQLAQEDFHAFLLPVDEALTVYPAVTVTEAQSVRFENGGGLALDRLRDVGEPGYYRVYSPDSRFLGLGEILPDQDEMVVRKRLVTS